MNLADYIDHTLLAPEAIENQYKKLCAEAIQYSFKTVCVPPMWVSFCAEQLKNNYSKVCTVIGFPLGYTGTELKVIECEQVIKGGAAEIDMVMNISLAKEGLWDEVQQDIAAVRAACKSKTLKVILETCLLTDQEIVKACQVCEKAGANFVKTSTGFSKAGASEHATKLMRETVSKQVQVKSSGGIRDIASAKLMIAAGATRLGTSSGVLLMQGLTASAGSY